ncbi:hypothetical protein [Rhodococcus opacus]|uniref:hypothetical protein n=1 Tax=Rhodococcus opacus TaxID=37919 RepID=UPI002954F876|nr:hypothetical protein [Rhodococcus opacus]MDV7088651.1 hypothetical protein [Rhodococcus opacus]
MADPTMTYRENAQDLEEMVLALQRRLLRVRAEVENGRTRDMVCELRVLPRRPNRMLWWRLSRRKSAMRVRRCSLRGQRRIGFVFDDARAGTGLLASRAAGICPDDLCSAGV